MNTYLFATLLGGPITDSRLGWLLGLCGLKGVGWALGAVVLPFFARDVIGLSATMLGVQWALNDGVQLIFTPLLGNLSDSVGRKWVIIGCVFQIGVLLGVTPLCANATEFIFVRSLSGIGQGVGYGTITAMVTDLASEAERAGRLSGLFFVVGVSFVMGAGMNAMITHFWNWSYTQVLFLGMVVVCSSCVMSSVLMGESLPANKRRPLCSGNGETVKESPRTGELWSVGLSLILAAKATSACGVMCWQVTYAFFIQDVFGWSAVEYGIIIATCGLISAGFQSMCFPALDRSWGSHCAAAACCAVFATTCTALPGCSLSFQSRVINQTGHLAVLTLMALTTACCEVAFPNLVAAYVPEPCLMGAAQGLTAAAKSVGWLAGPILGGALYDSKGLYMPYVAGGILSLIATSMIFASWLLLPTADESTAKEQLCQSIIKKSISSPSLTEHTPLLNARFS